MMSGQPSPSASTGDGDNDLHWDVPTAEVARWLAQCEPNEPLSPDDRRYRPMTSVRGDDAVEALYDQVRITRLLRSDKFSSCQLFSGYTGTGKSTELRRLRKLLQDEGYVVLFADAADYHDLFHPLSIQDLIVMVAGGFGEATASLLGKRVAVESYWNRFLAFLKADIEVQEFVAKLGPTDLKFALKASRPFWLKISDHLATSTRKLVEDAHDYVRSCIAHINAQFPNDRGIVFVFDSLERLRGPETELRAVMESMVRVFGKEAASLRLPECHCIYTMPPYVEIVAPDIASRYDGQVRLLPAIRVYQRGKDEAYEPGVEELTRLVAARIPLNRVFGSRQDLLRRLILASGGHLRLLLEMLNEMLMHGIRKGFPPTDEQMDGIISFFAGKARGSITREGVPILEHVRTTGAMVALPEGALGRIARYMDTRLVLCYRNGDGWYEVHPLIRDTVARLAAEQRAQEETRAGRLAPRSGHSEQDKSTPAPSTPDTGGD